MSAMRTLRRKMSKTEKPLTRAQALLCAVTTAAVWSWRRQAKEVK